MPTYTHAVPDAPPRERLDRYARRVFAALPSRKQARKAISAGQLTLNGEPTTSARFVRPGDTLVLTLSDAPRLPVLDLTLPVIFADRWLAVVHKPAGIHVRGNHARTLHRALRHNLPISAEPDALPDPDPVHRIDFRTQGLVLVARTAAARAALGRLFETRQIHKRYRAVLAGDLSDDTGRIDAPIDGREAASRWQVVGRSRSVHCDTLTTVDLFPETGRTHQLRRHMAALGCPILGDDLYHSGTVYRGNGLFLCATRQRFDHPLADTVVDAEIPEPAKFEAYRAREARRWQKHFG